MKVFLIFVLIGVARVASASADNLPWTIHIFIEAPRDLEKYAKLNLSEIEKAINADSLRSSGRVIRVAVSVETESSQSETWMYLDGRAREWRRARSRSMAHFGVAVDDRVKEFLMWSARRFNAGHHMLVLWGHGRGYSGKSNSTGFKPLELAKAIERSGFLNNHRRFDILLFDACLMQNLESVASFLSAADFIAGNEGLESQTGLPYGALVRLLKVAPNPLVAAHGLPFLAVSPPIGVASAAAIENNLLRALDQFGASLAEYLSGNFLRQAQMRRLTFKIDRFAGGYVDLDNFVTRIFDMLADEKPSARADSSFVALVQTTIELQSALKLALTGRAGASGLSVWVPQDSEEYLNRAHEFDISVFYLLAKAWPRWLKLIFT